MLTEYAASELCRENAQLRAEVERLTSIIENAKCGNVSPGGTRCSLPPGHGGTHRATDHVGPHGWFDEQGRRP